MIRWFWRRARLVARFAALLLTLATTSGPVVAADGAPRKAADAEKVARGKYLVTVAVCNDCHTPWKWVRTDPSPT